MRKPKPWFDLKYGWLQRKIPKQCVEDCAKSGECRTDCEAWIGKLKGFEESVAAVRQLAIDYLASYGAWTHEELGAMDARDLAVTVLWVGTGEIAESGEWFGLQH